jgi:hypothetical protein
MVIKTRFIPTTKGKPKLISNPAIVAVYLAVDIILTRQLITNGFLKMGLK